MYARGCIIERCRNLNVNLFFHRNIQTRHKYRVRGTKQDNYSLEPPQILVFRQLTVTEASRKTWLSSH